MKITESTIKVYYIRDRGEWADISIDTEEGKNSGRVSIASGWGNWSNYWGACGCGFTEFLTGLDIGYFAGKVGENQYFDFEKTITHHKRTVLEYRRNGYIESEWAREIYDELKDLEQNCAGHENEVCAYILENCSNLCSFCDSTPHLSREISPSFRQFWDQMWMPLFVPHLKKVTT